MTARPESSVIEIVSITPAPTEQERAAIEAALAMLKTELWPDMEAAAPPAQSPRWRYSGRRWHRRSRYSGWA